MHVTKYLGAALVAAVIFWGVGAVQAAPIPWAAPSGSTTNFTYNNGNTDNQLFVPPGQSPTPTSNGLLFFPSGFKAQSANGTASIVSDTLRFQLHAVPNKQLVAFTVNEFGDYSIFGVGPNTGVKVFGTVFLTNLDTGEVKSDTLKPVPPTPPTLMSTGVFAGQGSWQGAEAIAPIPAGWRNVQVVLNNELQANSDPGTSSVIEKKVVTTPGIDIEVIVPEPGTISLILVVGGLLISRRRVAVAA